jgi:hypothetical protein
MNRLVTLIWVLFTGIFSTFAQDVEFVASAPGVVETGQQFRLVYSVNAHPSSINYPDLKDLSVLMGPSVSSSSSVQIVNGRMSQSANYSYTFILVANKPGTWVIPPADIVVEGKKYQSNSLQIEVMGQAAATSSPGANTTNTTPGAEKGSGDVFLRVILDKRSVYQGEPIVATIKLYSKLNIREIGGLESPSFDGFFAQEIEVPPLRSLENENINGEVYGTGVLKRYALIPQRSGDLEIGLAKMDVVTSQRVGGRQRSVFDDFFGSPVQNEIRKLNSNPVRLSVKPLPTSRPTSFAGAVGQLQMKASLDKDKVKANEAITLKIVVSGSGNLRLLDPPKVSLPPGFESYDPRASANLNQARGNVSGSRTFEYLMIPRHEGTYHIPPVEFTWFDPAGGKYMTSRSSDFTIEVEKGEETLVATGPGLSRESVQLLADDIRYIKNKDMTLYPKGKYWVTNPLYMLGFVFFSILFGLTVFFARKRIRENADISRVKNKKANKVARKRLKTASTYLKGGNDVKFYEEMSRALWGYIGDKLGIPLADLSRERVESELRERSAGEEEIHHLLALVEECEFARYAPSTGFKSRNELLQEAIEAISKIEQIIR